MEPPRRAGCLLTLALLAAGAARGAAPCCDVKLPAPYDTAGAETLMRLCYPALDVTSGMLGVADEEGTALGGNAYEAKLWKGERDDKLLLLIETWIPEEDGARPEYGAAAYGLDLALFALEGGKPKRVAFQRDAWGHGGHGGAWLDLASYDTGKGGIAVGIRQGWMHMGETGEVLRLLLRDGASFREVFEREMLSSNEGIAEDTLAGDLGAKAFEAAYPFGRDTMVTRTTATLQIGTARAGWNDLVVVSEARARQEDGKLARTKVRETFAYDAATGKYVAHP